MSLNQNSLLTERLAVLLDLPIRAMTSAGTTISKYISALQTNGNLFGRYLAEFKVSSNTSSNAIQLRVLKASDTSGTGATAIVFATITNTNQFDNVWVFDVNSALIDTSNAFLALHVTSTTSSALNVGGTLFGGDCKYGTAATYNTSAVQAIQSA